MHVPHAFDATARPQASMPLEDIVRGISLALKVSVRR
jgi:pyrrolidone-carboxylate peptidase